MGGIPISMEFTALKSDLLKELASSTRFERMGIVAFFSTTPWARFGLRRAKRRSSLASWGFIFLPRRWPSVLETSKRDGWPEVANHGPIGDSWPIAFWGHARGDRVSIETRCPKARSA